MGSDQSGGNLSMLPVLLPLNSVQHSGNFICTDLQNLENTKEYYSISDALTIKLQYGSTHTFTAKMQSLKKWAFIVKMTV